MCIKNSYISIFPNFNRSYSILNSQLNFSQMQLNEEREARGGENSFAQIQAKLLRVEKGLETAVERNNASESKVSAVNTRIKQRQIGG